MLRATLLLALLGLVVAGGDSFTKKYAYSKIMANCWGEDNYHAYVKQLKKDSYDCKKSIYEEMKNGKEPDVEVNEAPLASFFSSVRGSSVRKPQYVPYPVYYQSSQAYNPLVQFNRGKREATYTNELLNKMVKKVKAKVGVLKCVLNKMGAIDSSHNLNTAWLKAETERYSANLDPALRADLVERIDKCYEFSKCVHDADSPIPSELQRIMAFLKCDKKQRVKICMKADLRKHMDEFDLSGLPEYKGDDDAKVEKLLHVLWGADPGTDPLDLLF